MGMQHIFFEQVPIIASCFKEVLQVEGRYVNGHSFVSKGDEIHLFYIDGEVGKGPYVLGNEIKIEHAVSKDLVHWEACGAALIRDEMLDFEERGIFSPYVIRKGELYYMFYTSHNMQAAQFICLAVSEDLFQWNRLVSNPLLYPSSTWAEWDDEAPCSCRDPHIYYDDVKGRYFMLWAADVKGQPCQSCIAASVSRDLVRWREMGPVLIRKHSEFECFTMKMEYPCLIRKDDIYYLFYRHGNGTKYCISDNFLDFTYNDSYYLGPCHASEIFSIQDQWYISSCSREVEDILHNNDRSKGLCLARLSWDGIHPYISQFE